VGTPYFFFGAGKTIIEFEYAPQDRLCQEGSHLKSKSNMAVTWVGSAFRQILWSMLNFQGFPVRRGKATTIMQGLSNHCGEYWWSRGKFWVVWGR